MKPLPNLLKELASPSILQLDIAFSFSALLQVLKLILDLLWNSSAFDEMAVHVLTCRVGTHTLGRGGEVLAKAGMTSTMLALEASVTDGSLGSGDVAIGCGERSWLDLRHEEKDVRRYIVLITRQYDLLAGNVSFVGT